MISPKEVADRLMGRLVVRSDGTKEWYFNGKRHREDGPAVEHPSGAKAWFLKGKRHRKDGPAVEFPNGTKEWWIKGEKIREDRRRTKHLPQEISAIDG